MVTIYPMSTYTQMETNKIMKRFMSLFVIANIILLQLHTVFLYKVPKMFLRCMDTNIPKNEQILLSAISYPCFDRLLL